MELQSISAEASDISCEVHSTTGLRENGLLVRIVAWNQDAHPAPQAGARARQEALLLALDDLMEWLKSGEWSHGKCA
eukprot:1160381-Pelagomonas_calceolata.AAC.4